MIKGRKKKTGHFNGNEIHQYQKWITGIIGTYPIFQTMLGKDHYEILNIIKMKYRNMMKILEKYDYILVNRNGGYMPYDKKTMKIF